jgi:putative transposase
VARSLRVLFPGAVYHVTGRGNQRRGIYLNVSDRLEFLELLGLGIGRFGWLCHGYCLMGNHYHLLIETPRPNLPLGMRHLNGRYTQSFNRSHGRVGHLFQGRYRAELVEKETHLLATVRYLALNPLRTRPPLCQQPEQWRWSSYPALLGLVPAPAWLTSDWILGQFDSQRRTARGKLKRFVNDAIPAQPELTTRYGVYIGNDEFIRSKTAGLEPIAEIPRQQWQPIPPGLDEIFAKDTNPIATAYREYGYTMREIADHLGCHYSTISRRLHRSEHAASTRALTGLQLRECKT